MSSEQKLSEVLQVKVLPITKAHVDDYITMQQKVKLNQKYGYPEFLREAIDEKLKRERDKDSSRLENLEQEFQHLEKKFEGLSELFQSFLPRIHQETRLTELEERVKFMLATITLVDPKTGKEVGKLDKYWKK